MFPQLIFATYLFILCELHLCHNIQQQQQQQNLNIMFPLQSCTHLTLHSGGKMTVLRQYEKR